MSGETYQLVLLGVVTFTVIVNVIAAWSLHRSVRRMRRCAATVEIATHVDADGTFVPLVRAPGRGSR